MVQYTWDEELVKLDQTLREFIHEFQSTECVGRRADAQGMRLYHYTDLNGMIGILSDKCLRATHYAYLNDASEIRYGANLARSLIHQKQTQHIRNPIVAALSDELESALENLDMYAAMYIACFCEDGNLLSQWRAYGQGGGFALGFHAEKLRDQCLASKAYLNKVLYDSKKQNEFIEASVDRCIGSIHSAMGVKYCRDEPSCVRLEMQDDELTDQVDRFVEKLIGVLIPAFVYFKDEAFKEEKEWRLVRYRGSDAPDVSFRTARNVLIPYDEIKLPFIEDISPGAPEHVSVMAGPAVPDGTKKSLPSFLKSKNVSAKVKNSAIPLIF